MFCHGGDLMKRFLAVCFCLPLMILAVGGCSQARPKPPVLTNCINIGNSLDAPKDISWGVPMDVSYFTIIKKAGFQAVRLPVRFSDYVDSGHSDYHLDDAFMKQLDAYVHAALNQHLTLILDMHHFLQIMNDPRGNEACLIAMWKQIAERYKSEPNTLVFEILNEPQGNLDSDSWNAILADTVKAMRVIDKKHFLIAGGTEYNSIDGLQKLKLPDDDRLIVTIHYYEPDDVTFQGDANADQNGEYYENMKDITWTGTKQETDYLDSRLKTAKTWADKHQVPLFIGEFGVNKNAPSETRVDWTAAVAKEAKALNMGYSYWEFASGFGIYDLTTGQWNNEMLHAILEPAS